MAILFLIGAAYIADKTGKPLLIAALLTLAGIIFEFLNKEPLTGIAIGAGITFIFCSIYFSVLVKYSSNLIAWLAILLGFPLLLFLLPVLAHAT